MTELHTELAEQDDVGVADVDTRADITLPNGVAAQDVGEVSLVSTEEADSGFGGISEERARQEVRSAYDEAGPTESDADDSLRDIPSAGGASYEHGGDIPARGDSSGRPPDKPPGRGDTGGDVPDPDDEIERREAMAEAGRFIMHLGRFTHGPQGVDLHLGEDTQITDRIKTELARSQIDSGLTPESVVGRHASDSRRLEEFGLDAVIKVETINEEILPLAEELDLQEESNHMPIARLFVFMKPEDPQSDGEGEDEELFSNSTADVSVWVYRDLRAGAYMMADPFDEAKGSQVESFFERLGLREVEIPVSDEDHRLGYDKFFPKLPSHTIRQINRFVRDQL